MSIQDKFKNIRKEPDTLIQAIKYLNLDGLDCRYEFWEWEGVEAESLIFCTQEVNELTDAFCRKLIGKICKGDLDTPIDFTSKSDEEFTYLNFNFKIKGD